MKQFSAEEMRISKEINAVYNSGNGSHAVEMAKDFLSKFPESPKARYAFAVMHGDYSSSPTHSPEEKARLVQIAKQYFAELFRDPDLNNWPKEFMSSVKNEYFWFFELPREQYELGINEIKNEDFIGGHYSACVGASMLALKALQSGDPETACDWAEKSIKHFKDYEVLVPHWYNINYFAAQALACLSRFDEAIECHRAMYKKQGGPENQAEISEFNAKIESIKSQLSEATKMTKEQMKSVIDKMIDAYNKHDVEGFLACFHPEMKSQRLCSNVAVAKGLEDFEAFFATAFKTNPNLKCEIKNQIVLDNAIVNEEFASGAESFPNGIHAAFVYSFKDGRIHRVWSTR